MSETKRRKLHTPEFKAKLGLEALSGVKTIHQIAQGNGVALRAVQTQNGERAGA